MAEEVAAAARPGLFSVVLAVAAHAQHTNQSTITFLCAQVADSAITIDGNLDEPAWSQSKPLSEFQTAGPRPVPARRLTTARLLWSGKRLFLSFDCKTDAIRSTRTTRDDAIWSQECAELFLCPRGSEAKYYEIDFNPQNTIYDNLLHSYRYQDQVKHSKEWALAYNARIESKTRITKRADGQVTGWTLEAAIPFRDLAEADHVPPRAGDVWWFNVFRIAQLDAKECEYSAWVPTRADFHKPWMFPRLRFVEADEALRRSR